MVIFLYGEDIFSATEKVKQIKEKFFKSNPTKSGFFEIDFHYSADKNFLSELRKELGARGLFFQKQILVVKNFIKESEKKESLAVADFLMNNKDIFSDQERVIIFQEEQLSKGKNPLRDLLLKSAKKQEFKNQKGVALSRWIMEKCLRSNLHVSISQSAAILVGRYCEGNLRKIDSEMEKLIVFKAGDKIEVQDVEMLVNAKTETDIFFTVEMASGGDIQKALFELHKHIFKGEDPHYIFSMYVYQFRNILKAGEFFQGGLRNQYEVAKLSGLHPFVVQKAMAVLNNLGFQKVREIYANLEKKDFLVKTGKLNIEMALDTFLAEIKFQQQ